VRAQPSLFESVGGGLSELGSVRRSRGVRAVELAEWRDDRNLLDRIILRFADGGQEFTADDVRPYLPLGIRPNSVGAAFLRAATKGWIEGVGYRQSERPEARSRRILVWRGTHVGDAA
jgi:hypothetical protein